MGIKCLHFNDPHIQGSTPSSRTDNFPLALQRKLKEIIKLSDELKVDCITIGGDIFNRPDTYYSVIRSFGKIFKKSKVPIYAIAGNHDLYGYNIKTLDRSALGLLDGFEIIRVLKDNEPVFIDKDGLRLQLTGKNFNYTMDKQNIKSNYFVKKDPSADYAFNVVHGNMLPKFVYKSMPTTLIEDIKTEADITVSGHFHPGIETIKREDNKIFMNCGALGRTNSSKYELTRTIKVALIDFDKSGINITEIPLKSAAKGSDVISREQVEEKEAKEEKFQSFVSEINQISDIKKYSSEEIINIISNDENVPADIKSETLKILGEAQEAVGKKDTVGDILLSDVFIKKIIMHNFQSHYDTETEFDEHGINAITGESNAGKSVILKALKWVLYNEQRGDNFISYEQTNCTVTIELPNNISITRLKTPSKNQYIVNINGNVEIYQGFGVDVPNEVIKVTGIKKISLNEEEKTKLSVHIASQLDGPFLLKLTGSNKAKAIGLITGVDVIDYAIENAKAQVRTSEHNKEICKKVIVDSTEKLKDYEDLDEFKNKLDLYESKAEEFKKVTERIKVLEEIQEKYNNIENKIMDLTQVVNRLQNLPQIESQIQRAEFMITDILKLQDTELRYNNTVNHINNCLEVLKETKQVECLLTKVQSLENLKDKINALQELQSKNTSIDNQMNICNVIIDKTKDLNKTLERVEYLNNIEDKIYSLNKVKEKINENNKALQNVHFVLKGTENVDKLLLQVNSLDQKKQRIADLSKVYDKTLTFKREYFAAKDLLKKLSCISAIEQKLQKVEQITEKVNTFKEINLRYKDIIKRTETGTEYVRGIATKMDLTLEKYKIALTKIERCPVCESRIDAKVIENIVNEFKKVV